MLDILQTFCTLNNLTFLYGETPAFNVDADRSAPILPILYHTGYANGVTVQDQQGAIESTYNLKLNLLIPSGLSDVPVQRLPRFNEVLGLKVLLIDYLSRDYVLSPVQFVEGINQTDRNLDGIQMTFTAKAKLTPSYCR